MKSILIAVTLLFINASCFGVITGKKESDKIVYIRIKLVEGKPSQVTNEVVQGKLKTPKVNVYKSNQIYYEVLSVGNSLLFEGAVDDPSTKIYEYVDEAGNLKIKEVKQDYVEMLIRVNYDESISKINLFKIPDDNSLKKNKDQFLPIGSFSINLNKNEE